jgi:ABC-2 type transport system ATP-binding protein
VVQKKNGLPIEIVGLTKRFSSVVAVDGLTFSVQPGRVTGFLGPNGSGKTTTMRILLGLVSATSGSATIGGKRYIDLANPMRSVGAVLESSSFHPARRARTHLGMVALASGFPASRVDEVLDLVGLRDDARRKVGGYSLGMRQRLQLAVALMGDPEVLILDEPSNGLDPQGIAWLRTLLQYLANEGRTVLVSSHLLAEISQMVDDVVIISRGTLKAAGPLSEVGAARGPSIRIRTPHVDKLIEIAAQAGFSTRRVEDEVVRIDGVRPQELGPLMANNAIVIYEMVQEHEGLEQLFLEMTTGLTINTNVTGI